MSPKTRARLGVAIASAVSAALTASGCSAGSDSSPAELGDAGALEVQSVTVANYRQGAIAPTFAAQDAGVLDEFGLGVDVTYVESSAAGLAALVGGDVQAAYSSYWGVIDAVQQGIDVVIVAENIRMNPDTLTFETLPTSGISSISDLEGATVSVPALNSGHHNRLRWAMLKEGLDPASVDFVELPYGEIASALQNRTIDVAAAAGPALTQLRSEFNSREVFDIADGVFKGAAEGGWIMSGSFAEENPNTVAAFQCAQFRGAELVQDDDTYKNILIEELGFEPGVAESEVGKKPIFPTDINAQEIGQFGEIMTDLGLLSDDFDVSSIILPAPETC